MKNMMKHVVYLFLAVLAFAPARTFAGPYNALSTWLSNYKVSEGKYQITNHVPYVAREEGLSGVVCYEDMEIDLNGYSLPFLTQYSDLETRWQIYLTAGKLKIYDSRYPDPLNINQDIVLLSDSCANFYFHDGELTIQSGSVLSLGQGCNLRMLRAINPEILTHVIEGTIEFDGGLLDVRGSEVSVSDSANFLVTDKGGYLVGGYENIIQKGYLDKYVVTPITRAAVYGTNVIYALSLPPGVVCSTSEQTLAIDLRRWHQIEARDTTVTFTHSVDAWGEASAAASADISFEWENAYDMYGMRRSATGTLGSYADADVVTWSTTKSGTYVFTHTPGSSISAQFNVRLPYDGTGTEEDPYVVKDAAGLAAALAAGGYIKLSADIMGDCSIPTNTTVYLDVNGYRLYGRLDNAGSTTIDDLSARGYGVFRSQVSGDGAFTNRLVKFNSRVVINSVQQRYPWNGLVDIDYTICELDTNKTYALKFFATVGGVTNIFGEAVEGEGRYTNVWDAAAVFGTAITNQMATLRAALYCTSEAEKKATPICRVCGVAYTDLATAFEDACAIGAGIEFLADEITVPPFTVNLTRHLDLGGVTLHTTMTIAGGSGYCLANANVDSVRVSGDAQVGLRRCNLGSLELTEFSGSFYAIDCAIESSSGPAVTINSGSSIVNYMNGCDISAPADSELIRIINGSFSLTNCSFDRQEAFVAMSSDGSLWVDNPNFPESDNLPVKDWFDVGGKANICVDGVWVYRNGVVIACQIGETRYASVQDAVDSLATAAAGSITAIKVTADCSSETVDLTHINHEFVLYSENTNNLPTCLKTWTVSGATGGNRVDNWYLVRELSTFFDNFMDGDQVVSSVGAMWYHEGIATWTTKDQNWGSQFTPALHPIQRENWGKTNLVSVVGRPRFTTFQGAVDGMTTGSRTEVGTPGPFLDALYILCERDVCGYSSFTAVGGTNAFCIFWHGVCDESAVDISWTGEWRYQKHSYGWWLYGLKD